MRVWIAIAPPSLLETESDATARAYRRCFCWRRVPATERALRGMVVGRKNHHGSRSRRGTEVAALFYSLVESAKLCGVEPNAYLLRALRAALATPGTVTLPHTLPS